MKLVNRQGITLATFALLIGSVLSTVNWVTRERIEDNKRRHLIRLFGDVVSVDFDNAPQDDQKILIDQQSGVNRTVYVARNNGEPVACIVRTIAPDGYAGPIELLIGIDRDGSLTGVRVASHRETPGLGDAIETDRTDWILQFDNQSLSVPVVWAVRRDGGDFDQLTGATVTPRAIVRAVHETLQFFQRQQQQIFN